MNTIYLWVRLGDRDEYNCFDDLELACEYLQEAGDVSDIIYWKKLGFEALGFERCNYISFFWGDDDAQCDRGLSSNEQAEVERLLGEQS